MLYQTEIEGMHCNSCKNLITMVLEDQGLSNIKIDLLGNTAKFESSLDLAQVDSILKDTHHTLEKYKFFNLSAV